MSQEVQIIKLKDLVLWTENPRDSIDPKASDQEIVDRALEDRSLKWTLPKLAKEMGDYYDFSELPTVVYHGSKPVVYDGNRRIILGKIKHGLVNINKNASLNIPHFPEELPCNVCSKKIGLQNVYRKHSDSGSWQPLERDIFLHKHMGEEKSTFYILDEDTGIIKANPHLNQRFVKEEVFRDENLKSMGFSIRNGRLYTVHSTDEAHAILSDLSQKIEGKELSTRKNRGKVIEVLEPNIQELIDLNKNKHSHLSKVNFVDSDSNESPRITRRTAKKESELFGGKLYLRIGEVSNLYRDIVDLYEFYILKKNELSQSFPGLIRMSLRLLCETAANERRKRMDDYLKENFENAKKALDQDIKTYLSGQNINKDSIMQLLHTGAHKYKSTPNVEQTIALSIILGAILTITHGKKD